MAMAHKPQQLLRLVGDWDLSDRIHSRFSLLTAPSCSTIELEHATFRWAAPNEEDQEYWLIIANGLHPHEYSKWQIKLNEKNNPHSKLRGVIGVIMEPSWINIYHRAFLEHFCSKILIHIPEEKFSLFHLNPEKYVSCPGLIAPSEGITYKTAQTDFLSKKSRLCSTCITGIPEIRPMLGYDTSRFPHDPKSYRFLKNERIDFVKTLLRYSSIPIDVYGRGWTKQPEQKIFGAIETKKEALEKYTFSLAIENCCEPGYFTEKLVDCLIFQTIPIYYGCPNIYDYFDKDVVLTLSDLTLESWHDLWHNLQTHKIQPRTLTKKERMILWFEKNYNLLYQVARVIDQQLMI